MTRDYWTEEVNGTVIGSFTWPYQFWSLPKHGPVHCIARGHFENDDQAAAWFKANYPDDFGRGAEMRIYDQQDRQP